MAHTIATLPRMQASTLSSILLAEVGANTAAATEGKVEKDLKTTAPEKIAIIDVRDADHIGGHIRHSTHVPSSTLSHAIPSLVHKLKHKEIVVFHCALSQQRGPGAALSYLRERERLLGSGTTIGEEMKRSAAESKGKEGKEEDGNGEWVDVDERKGGKEQRVYVLDRGFVGWQEVYGEDERLTEGYSRELWKEGYWM